MFHMKHFSHYVSHETFSLIKTNYNHKTKQWMDMM